MLKFIFCTAFFFSIIITISAYTDSSYVAKVAGLKVHQGIVLVHSQSVRSVQNSYPGGIEFDFSWHKFSKSAWESCFCYPKTGVATTFWNYDNPEVLGFGITSMFYIEPVFGASKRLSFSIRAGLGLSYQSRPYHPETNPNNQSYSTYVAFPLQIGGSLHFRLKPKWYLDVSALFNHFSNGGIKEPNAGINWPSGAIGLSYYLNQTNFVNRIKNDWRENQNPETRFDFTFFMAFNEPVSKLYMFSPGLELKVSSQISRINALTAGMELLADNFASHEMERAGVDENHFKWSVAIGHEFLLGKFLFSQQIGLYLFKKYIPSDDLYHRWGLVYRFNQKINFGINLKVHRHIADFIDFRIGYTF